MKGGVELAINKITIKQQDKYQTVVHPYYTDKEPLGSVVVLHGMAEHHERYIPFAKFLNENGYDVFLYDHRGHGCDKKFEDLGHFADNNGYKLVVSDAITVLRYAKSVNRGKKFILFSHSMGSLIARNVIQYYDAMDGVVICGTAYMAPIVSAMGGLLAGAVKLFKGAHYYSPFLNNVTVGYKDFAKISSRTAFDWLTRENNAVGAYMHDPYCGFVCTAAFYKDMIKLTNLAAQPKRIKKTRRDINILMISGSHDPVGNYGQGVMKLFALYQRYGFLNSDCTIYEEARHELLNEINKDTVMSDILEWIEKIKTDVHENIHDDVPKVSYSEEEEENMANIVNESLDQLNKETEGEKKLAQLREEKRKKKKDDESASRD